MLRPRLHLHLAQARDSRLGSLRLAEAERRYEIKLLTLQVSR
jgi:hypothetical protein